MILIYFKYMEFKSNYDLNLNLSNEGNYNFQIFLQRQYHPIYYLINLILLNL
jgi:hypothetical protein